MFSQYIDTKIKHDIDFSAERFKLIKPKYKKSKALAEFMRNEDMCKPISTCLMKLKNFDRDELWYPGDLPNVRINQFHKKSLQEAESVALTAVESATETATESAAMPTATVEAEV
jgi:hypothetical protein